MSEGAIIEAARFRLQASRRSILKSAREQAAAPPHRSQDHIDSCIDPAVPPGFSGHDASFQD